MYAVSEDRPRGSSADQSGRQFPVLFHLMDVSRARAIQPPTIDSANLLNAVEQLHWPPADDSESSLSAVTAPDFKTAIDQTPIYAEVVPAAPQPEITASDSTPSHSPSPENAVADTTATPEPTAPVASAEPLVATVERPSTPPPSSPLVTLRKKPKTSASEDWFASHGKFIAVAFVLALIATIYFARVNRERAAVAKQDPASPSPLVETSPAIAAASPSYQNTAKEAPTVQTVSVATPAAASTPSPVELRAPELVSGPTADKSKDNLFEFAAAKNGDDRIAARAEEGSKTAAPALTAPALTGGPEVIATPAPYSPTAASLNTSAYPAASSPATHYPVSIPPASYPTTPSPALQSAPALAPPVNSGYQPQSQYAPPHSQYAPPAAPPTDYRSQYPVTPASMPQQPAAQAWSPGQPASYPSYDTTARGPRNERTGSGTY